MIDEYPIAEIKPILAGDTRNFSKIAPGIVG